MEDSNLKEIILAYQDAFKERDLSKCMSYFSDNASIKFLFATYQGYEAIENWHKDRFNADLKLLKIESIQENQNNVVVNLIATSKRLNAFKIKSMKGTGTYLIEKGMIVKAKYSPRKGVASHMDWHFS